MLVRMIPSSDGKEFDAFAKDHLREDRRYLSVYGIEIEGATYVERAESVIGLDPDAL